jgi:ubiquinone/menaquinone biosynthesis C-methylase UbiE
MESVEDARDYDEMDHRDVNRAFVDDLLAAAHRHGLDLSTGVVLDVGTGTALIPIELCARHEDCRVMATDLSINMLELARYRVEAAGLIDRIQLGHSDSKRLPYDDGAFAVVMSNSIVHHVPSPIDVVREAVRVLVPGGLIFFRDLLRPATTAEVDRLVKTYTGGENAHSQQLFHDSLHAALTLDEVRSLVGEAGFDPTTVAATSDRHWTWVGRKHA